MTARDPAPLTDSAPRTESDETPLWIAGVGGALLAFGLGAFAWHRRQRRVEQRDMIVASSRVERTAAPAAAALRPSSVPAPVPTGSRPDFSLAPASLALTPRTASPAISEPVPAAAPRTAMPLTADPLSAERWPELEAMVAAPPSAENPFLTRTKRMRRAKYLMAQGQRVPMGGAEQPVAAAPAAAVTGNRQYKPQPVYDFGKATPIRRPNWKPATT